MSAPAALQIELLTTEVGIDSATAGRNREKSHA